MRVDCLILSAAFGLLAACDHSGVSTTPTSQQSALAAQAGDAGSACLDELVTCLEDGEARPCAEAFVACIEAAVVGDDAAGDADASGTDDGDDAAEPEGGSHHHHAQDQASEDGDRPEHGACTHDGATDDGDGDDGGTDDGDSDDGAQADDHGGGHHHHGAPADDDGDVGGDDTTNDGDVGGDTDDHAAARACFESAHACFDDADDHATCEADLTACLEALGLDVPPAAPHEDHPHDGSGDADAGDEDGGES